MKYFIAIVASFCLLASIGVKAEVTPMELRTMQTRVFEKPPEEVYEAVIELCRDYDLTPTGKFSKGGLTCLNLDVSEQKKRIFSILFDCKKCEPDHKKAVVRIRTTFIKRVKQWQEKDPAHYSALFDALAQYLFIEAIDWSPEIQY